MRLRPAVALLALAGLGACKEEPSFDERYADAEKTIRQKAAEMDSALARGEDARAVQDELAGGAEGASPSPPEQ